MSSCARTYQPEARRIELVVTRVELVWFEGRPKLRPMAVVAISSTVDAMVAPVHVHLENMRAVARPWHGHDIQVGERHVTVAHAACLDCGDAVQGEVGLQRFREARLNGARLPVQKVLLEARG